MYRLSKHAGSFSGLISRSLIIILNW